MTEPLLSDLAISRLNAVKSQGKTLTSTKGRAADYQQGISDSIILLKDLFKKLNIPVSPKYA